MVQDKAGGFIILRSDQVAVCADDNPFQSLVHSDPPDCFLQLQPAVSTAFVMFADPVVADLNLFRPVARIPRHKPDGLSVQEGNQAVFVGDPGIVIKEAVRLPEV